MSESRSILECPVCFEAYGQETHVPLIGTCGHSICCSCRELNITYSCPVCRRPLSFLEKHKNYTTIELLTALSDLKKTVKSKATSAEDGCLHCRCVITDAEALVCKQCIDFSGENEAVLTALKKGRICEDCGSFAGQHGHELTKYSDVVLEISAKCFDEEIKTAFPKAAMDSMMNDLDGKMTQLQRNFSALKERINNVSCTRPRLQQLGLDEGRRILTESKNCVRNARTAYEEGNAALDGLNSALLNAVDLVDKFKAPVPQETRPESAVQRRAPVTVPPRTAEASRPFLPGQHPSTATPRSSTLRAGPNPSGRRVPFLPTAQPSSSRAAAAPGSTSRLSVPQRLRTRVPSAGSSNT